MVTDAADIRIGIIGMGAMGKGLLHQSTITPGLRCMAVCDLDTAKAAAALAALDIPHEVAANQADSASIVATGKVAVLACGEDLSRSRLLDIVIEASNGVSTAIDHCLAALAARKHLVLMNAEVDLTYGPLLARIAHENGVVSTSCGGDQYGVLKDLLDDLEAWGFDLVMAGNIKGFLDRYANPTTIVPEADKRNLDYRMCTSYTDGSKLNIEMAIVANAYDMVPVRTGMTGPRLNHVTEVFEAFDFRNLWCARKPLVDYALGAEPGGGVFAIGHCDHPYQRDMLKYYKMGDGPFYLFYRPYHLCHIEAMAAVKHAVRGGRAFMQPGKGLKTNVYAYAKKDLAPGDVLDGLGGYCVYGLIETVAADMLEPGVPVCLAHDILVRKPIRKDEKVLLSHLAHDAERADFRHYAEALQCSV